MSRPPRFSYSGALHHVTMRCNNREFLFTDASFGLFRQILQQARAEFDLSLYNYCLMNNHVHLLFEVKGEDDLSKAMHWIANTFSRKFNKSAKRQGHLWEGRYRSTIVEDESYFFRCMAYVDLNPVRAKIVTFPLEYRWCGHRALHDEDRTELDFHRLYIESGREAASRYNLYAGLLAEEARRAPVPLATQYFVGARMFVVRMIKRFGLDAGKLLKYNELDSGLVTVGPQHGGRPHSK